MALYKMKNKAEYKSFQSRWKTPAGYMITGEATGVVAGEVAHQLGTKMTVPDKPNSSLQKYHLTSKGRDLIVKLAKEENQG